MLVSRRFKTKETCYVSTGEDILYDHLLYIRFWIESYKVRTKFAKPGIIIITGEITLRFP